MTKYQVSLRNIKNGVGAGTTEALIEAGSEAEAGAAAVAKYEAAGRTVSVVGVKVASAEFIATVEAARTRAGASR